jgi:hypothetical protein
MTTTIKKSDKIIYWIATGLVEFLFLGSAIFYFVKHDMVLANMAHLGYPAYLSLFLPFTKILGGVIILTSKWKSLKEWAYSGLFINCILAAIAHGNSGDGWINPGTIGSIFLLVSYFYSKKIGK